MASHFCTTCCALGKRGRFSKLVKNASGYIFVKHSHLIQVPTQVTYHFENALVGQGFSCNWEIIVQVLSRTQMNGLGLLSEQVRDVVRNQRHPWA